MKGHKILLCYEIIEVYVLDIEDVMHVSETPDSEDDLIEIVDSQSGVACITISDNDDIIAPSSPKTVRQMKLRLKLHCATSEYQNCQTIQFYQVHSSLIYLI